MLLGGSHDGPALAVPTRWGAKVAGRTRDDGELHVSVMHRLNDGLVLDLSTRRAETIPAWAIAVPGLAASWLDRESGGASLLAYMDVPDESGIMAGAALHAALALALSAIAGLEVDPAKLLSALGGGAMTAAAQATSLLGRYGHAMVVSAGSPEPHHIAFDPAAAGLRLVLMSARPGEAVAPMQHWTPDPSDDTRVAPAADAISRQDWHALGTLLTAAHHAGAAHREPAEADLLVDCALATGSLGGRATSSTTALALVPARSLHDLRSAAVHAFAGQGRPAPRFLTTGALPPAVARPESLLGS